MTPDNARLVLDRIKAYWPAGRWTPVACQVWATNLEELDYEDTVRAVAKIAARTAEVPAWSTVLAETRAFARAVDQTTDLGPGLPIEEARPLIESIREQYPFITRKH